MASRRYHDYEGLQHVATERPKYPDQEGMHVIQSNEKQVVPAPEKEALYSSQYAVDHPEVVQSPSTRRFCGLSKRAFVIMTVAAFLLVVGAAVGGGIGGSLASKSSGKEVAQTETSSSSSSSSGGAVTVTIDRSASSTTSAATTTSTANPIQTATTSEGTYNCPSQNATTYIPSISPTTLYIIICDADQPAGVPGSISGTVKDLNDGVVATSIESCIDACAGNALGGGGCTAVTYGANITLALSRGGITGNCFLKNQRAETFTVDDSGQTVSAFLSG